MNSSKQHTKKICHVTSVHKWNDIRIFQKECRSLVKIGFDVHFLVANSEFEGIEDGVKIVKCDIGQLSRINRILKASRLMRNSALSINADIYHLHDPELIPLGKVLTQNGKKVIFDSHEDTSADILEKDLFPWLLKRLASLIYSYYEKTTVLKFAGLISVTETITHSFNHPHSETIKNYPVLEFFTDIRCSYNSENKKYVMYAGGLTRVRGIKEIIQAMRFIPEYTLILAGAFDSNDYFQECKALDEWKQVEFVGYVPLKKVYEYLATASLGFTMLYPTEGHVNSLPIKTFEYMAAGIPVLMTDMPYWREMFKDYGFYANAYDFKDIGTRARQILDSDNIQLIERAKTLVYETFDWNNEAEKLNKFYHLILSNS